MNKDDLVIKSHEKRIEALIKRFDLSDYLDSHLVDNFEDLTELDIFTVLDAYDCLDMEKDKIQKQHDHSLDLLKRLSDGFEIVRNENRNYQKVFNLIIKKLEEGIIAKKPKKPILSKSECKDLLTKIDAIWLNK